MTQRTGRTPAEIAERYVAAFREGTDLAPPSQGLLVDGEPDEGALQVLESHLLEEEPQVRENIVNLLADVGTQSLSLRTPGIEAMEHDRVVRILAGQGLAKPDMARERAMELLRKYCLQSSLAKETGNISRALAERPSTEALLLVAKAKAMEARGTLAQLAQLDEWGNDRELLIAMSALGDTTIAQRYFGALEVANADGDPEKFQEAIRDLSCIGTPEALKVVAENLRTPLILDVVGSYQKTMRFAVLEGLSYNYPDQPMLYPNYIITEEDFREAERFCERTLGAVYQGPVPPFMTYRGHPEPMPGEK